MAAFDGELIQLVLLLAQGLWGLVFWQFSNMNAKLTRIEEALQNNHLTLVRDYTLQKDHDGLRDRVHSIAGNVQTLRAYDALRPHLNEDKSRG